MAATTTDALAAALAGRRVLGADEASALAAAAGLPSAQSLLPRLVAVAARAAVTPTSAYPVGAAALGASGAVYLGHNLELPAAPLAASVHAEQFAVAAAAQAGETGLVRIAVSAPPCGHCRQFCYELAAADALEFVFADGGADCGGDQPGSPRAAAPAASCLGALLPRAFGPADLARGPSADGGFARADAVPALPAGRPPTPPPGRGRGPAFLLSPPPAGAAGLRWAPSAAAALAGDQGASAACGRLQAAAAAALAAARACHAPHTHCPAAVALVWEAGGVGGGGGGRPALAVSAGGVIESAAYNPTLPPLQAALVAAFVAGLPAYAAVRAAVLVERAGARISHAGATAAALASVGEEVPLTVLHVEWGGGGDEA